MSSAISAFNWRNKPSIFAADLKFVSRLQGGAGLPAKDPINLTFSKRSHTSSIASAEKLKQRPGTGRSATA